MQPQAGYFSLVQFCPDVVRLEAVNVGVLLFCPAIDFVEIKLNEENDRVAKVFGKDAFNPRSLDAAKSGLRYRLTKSEDRPKTREDLERFISARGDYVRLSVPRPLVTDDPQKELESLFQKVVLEPKKTPSPRPPVVPELDVAFQKLKEEGRAKLNLGVKLPVVGRTIRVPYAYLNGAWNLVKAQRFSADDSTAAKSAMISAVEGDLLAKHPFQDGIERKLIVVAAFAPSVNGHASRKHIFDVLAAYKVRTVRIEQVSEFVKQVQLEAH